MDTPYAILRPGAKAEAGSVDLPPRPDYRELKATIQHLLGGVAVERVFVLHNGQYTDMFVGETSAILGAPRNEAATKVYRNNFMTHHPGENPESLAAIYGDAILFSRKVWF
jgi:hypothetical protein